VRRGDRARGIARDGCVETRPRILSERGRDDQADRDEDDGERAALGK